MRTAKAFHQYHSESDPLKPTSSSSSSKAFRSAIPMNKDGELAGSTLHHLLPFSFASKAATTSRVLDRIRQFIFRPAFLIIFLIVLLVNRESYHSSSGLPMSTSLSFLRDRKTQPIDAIPNPIFHPDEKPLLNRNVSIDRLPLWQREPIMVDGQARRRNPLLPAEELRRGEIFSFR